MCLSEESPYRDYNGSFPSGHNWDSYIEWVRLEMYRLLEMEVVDDSDDDPDEIPSTVSGDEDGADLEDTDKDKEANAKNKDQKDNTEGGSKIDDGTSKDDVEADPNYVEIDDDEAPDDWYFKGYLAFALWGFIPAPGGEKYKSILMGSVDDFHSKRKHGSRKEIRQNNKDRSDADRKLDKRGETKDEENISDKNLTNLMVNGRMEMQSQKIYESKVSKLQYQVIYHKDLMQEVKEEMAFLDSDDKKGKKALQDQWRALSKKKDSYYQEWLVVTEEERTRREGVVVK